MISSKFMLLLGAVTACFAAGVEVETRSLDEIHQEALKEGGTLTVWHGGDEKNQQDGLKEQFEARFPGITLNITVDLSKYHDARLDGQIAANNVYVDSIILQTLHDYPRWKSEDALLQYKPLGWDSIYEDYRDEDGYYNGVYVLNWSNVWNTDYVTDGIVDYDDFLKPEFKDKLVLTYPNDDDAVLYAFDLVLKEKGEAWLDALIAQNPRWVRGTATPATLIGTSNGTYTASFTTGVGLTATPPFNVSFPANGGPFVTWPQTGAILKNAPHPESAKLLHSFVISDEYKTGGWRVRSDAAAPEGYPAIVDVPGTNTTGFKDWMQDRAEVERLRFYYEDKLGTAQGLSPLEDDL